MFFNFSGVTGISFLGTAEADKPSLAGDDSVNGSRNGGSMQGALFGGNDYVELNSGLLNKLQTSWGSDTINTYGGGGQIRGGNDNDTINIVGGQFDIVKGGPADDILSNWCVFAGTVAGGRGNDTLINYKGGGYFFGGPGRDTFKPYSYYQEGCMFIEDFTPGEDVLDVSGLASDYNIFVLDDGISIGVGDDLVAFLTGVYSL